MRELTFPGFLKRYVRELSLSGTTSLFALAGEAAGENPRLREPLFLYALFSEKEDLLLRAVKDTPLKAPYAMLLQENDKGSLRKALESSDPALPAEYHKVWRSYLSLRDRKKSEDATKDLMRDRILAMQKAQGVSNYRLYTDLELNPGNINAWLKHGKSEKVSLATARRAMEYLSARQ